MSEKKENIKEERKPKKVNKRKHRLIKLLVIFLVIFLIAEVFFYFFASSIIRKYIQKTIEKESNGLYHVDFDKFSIDLSTGTFKLKKFKFYPDTIMLNKLQISRKYKKAIYSIYFESLIIKRINIIKLVRKKKLHIKSINIEKPVIKLINKPGNIKKKTIKYDAVHNDLYPAMEPYINELYIKEIKLNNGFFDLAIEKQTYSTQMDSKISIELHKFIVNQHNHKLKDKLFYSENIKILMDKYDLKLKDNIHTIKASKIIISTHDSSLSAKYVSLKPSNIRKKWLQLVKGNLFEILIPKIEITGFDVNKAYFEKKINIKSFIFSFPDIKIALKNRKNNKEISKKRHNLDLYKLIEGKLDYIKVDTFFLRKAKLKLYNKSFKNAAQYSANEFTIKLIKFDLNKKSYSNNKKILLSDNILFRLKSMKMILADKVHKLEANYLYLSSENKLINAKNVKLIPLSNTKFRQKNKYNIQIPNLEIDGINMHKVYNDRELQIVSFKILNAKLNIISHFTKNNNNRTINKKSNDLKSLSLHYIKLLKIRNFLMYKTTINLSKYINDSTKISYKSKLSFLLTNFEINPQNNKNKKFLYADHVNLNLEDYSMDLKDNIHVLKAKSINLSTKKSLLNIENISLQAHEGRNGIDELKKNLRSDLFNFKISKLHLTGIDFYEMYFNKKLNINNINITKPNIKITKYKNLFRNDTVVVFSIIDTSLNSLEEQEKKIIATLEEVVNIINESKNKIDSTNVQIMDTLLVRNKTLDLFNNYIEVIDVKNINLTNGKIRFLLNDSLGNKILSFKNQISLSLNNFFVDIDSLDFEKPYLFPNKINLKLRNNVFELPGKLYEISVKNINLSTNKKSLTLNNIMLKNNKYFSDSMKTKSYFNIYIPKFEARNIDIDKYYYDNILNISNIELSKPSIFYITHPKIKKDSTKKIKFKLKKIKLPKFIKHLNVNNLVINNGNIGFINKLKNSEFIFSKGNFNMNIDSLRIDSNLIGENGRINDFGNIELVLKNYNLQLPDSIHTLRANKIYFSSNNSSFRFDSLRINHLPKINNSANTHKKNMLYDISLPILEINNFDYNKLLTNKDVHIKSIYTNNTKIDLEVFQKVNKKKNIPFTKINLYNKIKGKLNSICIGKVKSENTEIKFKKIDAVDSITSINLKNIDFRIDKLKIDSTKNEKLLYSDNIDIKLRQYAYNPPNSLYRFETHDIGISTKDSVLYINNISMHPNYERSEVPKIKGFQKSVLYLHGDKINIKKFDLKNLIEKKEIRAENIRLKNINLHVYKDKNYLFDSTRRPKLLNNVIFKLKNYIRIDTVLIENSFVSYEQFNRGARNTGIITFEKLNGIITNMTNDSIAKKQKEVMRMKASTYVMGKSLLSASFRFPINSENGEYVFAGSLDSMDLNYLNPIVENIAFVSVRSGIVNNLRFSALANNSFIDGKMQLNYNDLKISIKSKTDKDSTKTSSKGLVSLVANTIIRSNNPKRKNGRLREGKIYYERDTYRPIFHYWTQAVLSGLKASLGFKSKQLKERIKNLKKQGKLSRKQRKQKQKLDKKTKRKLEKEVKKENKLEVKRQKKLRKDIKKRNRKNKDDNKLNKNEQKHEDKWKKLQEDKREKDKKKKEKEFKKIKDF